MKTVFNFFLAAGVLCVLAGCASESVTVTTDHDPAAHFAAYKTYTLAPPARGETLSPVGEAALQESVRTELAKRGITEAPGKNADLDVVRQVFVHEKVSVFRGVGKAVVGGPESNAAKIRAAVAKIVDQFPRGG